MFSQLQLESHLSQFYHGVGFQGLTEILQVIKIMEPAGGFEPSTY